VVRKAGSASRFFLDGMLMRCSKEHSNARRNAHRQRTPKHNAECSFHYCCPARSCSHSAKKSKKDQRYSSYEWNQDALRGKT
jgi:hypothetical protein